MCFIKEISKLEFSISKLRNKRIYYLFTYSIYALLTIIRCSYLADNLNSRLEKQFVTHRCSNISFQTMYTQIRNNNTSCENGLRFI